MPNRRFSVSRKRIAKLKIETGITFNEKSEAGVAVQFAQLVAADLGLAAKQDYVDSSGRPQVISLLSYYFRPKFDGGPFHVYVESVPEQLLPPVDGPRKVLSPIAVQDAVTAAEKQVLNPPQAAPKRKRKAATKKKAE